MLYMVHGFRGLVFYNLGDIARWRAHIAWGGVFASAGVRAGCGASITAAKQHMVNQDTDVPQPQQNYFRLYEHVYLITCGL